MNAKIGHAHVKVRDVERATAFYSRFLGLQVRERFGDRFVFMSGTDSHHELALQNVGSEARAPGRFDIGLFHVAFEVPDKQTLASSYQNLMESEVAVAPVDHRISWALYFSDPDGNGVELYCDTRKDDDGTDLWQGNDRPLTPEMLLAHLTSE
jgi:catechol 2,3-dioxygenase